MSLRYVTEDITREAGLAVCSCVLMGVLLTIGTGSWWLGIAAICGVFTLTSTIMIAADTIAASPASVDQHKDRVIRG